MHISGLTERDSKIGICLDFLSYEVMQHVRFNFWMVLVDKSKRFHLPGYWNMYQGCNWPFQAHIGCSFSDEKIFLQLTNKEM